MDNTSGNMKNKEFTYKVNDWCIIGIVLIVIYLACTSCTAQRYQNYSKKECHWDTGTYEAQMKKKDNR